MEKHSVPPCSEAQNRIMLICNNLSMFRPVSGGAPKLSMPPAQGSSQTNNQESSSLLMQIDAKIVPGRFRQPEQGIRVPKLAAHLPYPRREGWRERLSWSALAREEDSGPG